MSYGIGIRQETGHVGAEGAAKNKVVSRLGCAKRAVTRAAKGGPARVTALVTFETRH